MSVRLSHCLSVSLSVRLSVCLSVWREVTLPEKTGIGKWKTGLYQELGCMSVCSSLMMALSGYTFFSL